MVEFAGPAIAGLARAKTNAITPIALMKQHLACRLARFKSLAGRSHLYYKANA